MKKGIKVIIAACIGVAAMGVTAASAQRGDRDRDDRDRRIEDDRGRYDRDDRRDSRRGRPDRCGVDHDHRGHSPSYYDYYAPDRYFRAGAYRGGGVTLSIDVGNDRRYNDRRYNDRRYYDRGYARGRQDFGRSRIVRQRTFDTRGRARIILTEEEFRRGYRICTVTARGPDARFVSPQRMRSIARNNCSRRADIRIL